MFKVPERYRITHSHPLSSNSSYGNNGAFVIPSFDKGGVLVVIASDGLGREHVSVHVKTSAAKARTPSWVEMCQVKDLFWSEEDVVIQYHPAKSNYVNVHPNTLHLWRPTDEIAGHIPLPPLELV